MDELLLPAADKDEYCNVDEYCKLLKKWYSTYQDDQWYNPLNSNSLLRGF